MITTRRFLTALCTPLVAVTLFTSTASAQTSTTTTQPAGAATTTTEQLSGEVVQVDGNNLIVRMANGDVRTFSNIPDSRRATVDGKQVSVRELRPGTRLNATITRTMTPVTVRTTTVGTGTVVYAVGSNVVLRLPSGEIRQYTVAPTYQFTVNGKPATANDLRPGMTVSAEKIVEEPRVEIALNSTIVGQSPGAQGAAAGGAPTAAAARGQAAGTAPAQGAGGQGAGAAPATGAGAPATLPSTGSPLPLVGLLGLLFVGGSYVMRRLRRA
jgi:LPXTG-motif cell wall-anchored protein